MYELTIIGGGPAGITAGIYAARKKLKTVFITPSWGGQSIVSDDIQNWIGTPHISGQDLANNMKAHLMEYKGDTMTIEDGATVKTITKNDDQTFTVSMSDDKVIETKAILIATGSGRRKLPAKGADEFEHKGLTYCATCDAPLFSGRDVIVVGGGNSAFETASQLLDYAKTVTIINRTESFRADEITVEKMKKNDKISVITNAQITEVIGDVMVTGLKYIDTTTNEEKELATGGIFVEIGHTPNTDFVSDIVELNDYKKIVVDPYTQETKTKGIWSAGDCTDGLYHQNNIASGDAVKALENIYAYLRVH